ncbi:MAG: tRNA (adenosine(37)-N6)-dimethylallyltransferase MiaA, partial [Clostridia bacterium]|nr:tRNA (adenosine(37)-N6)-dimethylallyltransferase MiaA [Clostridia bacterium]
EEESRKMPSPYHACVIGLNYRDRSRLYDRINKRVDCMVEDGLVQEVEGLYKQSPNGTILQAIGVKEFAPYFAGECSLENVFETIQRESRRYAKRQLTWFRRDERVCWLYPDDYEAPAQLYEQAQNMLEKARVIYDREEDI